MKYPDFEMFIKHDGMSLSRSSKSGSLEHWAVFWGVIWEYSTHCQNTGLYILNIPFQVLLIPQGHSLSFPNDQLGYCKSWMRLVSTYSWPTWVHQPYCHWALKAFDTTLRSLKTFFIVIIIWSTSHQLESKSSLILKGFGDITDRYRAWELKIFIQLMMERFYSDFCIYMNHWMCSCCKIG